MQNRSIIFTSVALAIAVALGIIYLISSPDEDLTALLVPTATPLFTPTSNPEVTETTDPTDKLFTPTPMPLARRDQAPSPTNAAPSPTVSGATVTAKAGTSEGLVATAALAMILGSVSLIRQVKKA